MDSNTSWAPIVVSSHDCSRRFFAEYFSVSWTLGNGYTFTNISLKGCTHSMSLYYSVFRCNYSDYI